MDEILQKQFMTWALREIINSCWSENKEEAIGIILGKATAALSVLLGTDEDRRELWDEFLPECKTQIEFTSLDWEDHVLESLNQIREVKQRRNNQG